MTGQDWFDLNQKYIAVFGEKIPRMMLPADEEAAAAIVRQAIETHDDSVFERNFPASAVI